ncbi:MAG: HAMP domain-containing protein [Deltaproteobacteria bacterium]|nr:HAMP domain-containing protein [Deltaproteobacteria bacterium]
MAAIFVTLLVSHKLAGPLFRFQKELDQIGEGNLTQAIKLREKDQISAMAESLEQMRVSLQGKVVAIKEDVEKIIESASGKDVPPELMKQLNQLHQNIGSNFEV